MTMKLLILKVNTDRCKLDGSTNTDQTLVPEKRTPPRDTRMDKSAANRTAFRSRKLQLSDVNW